MCIQTELFKVKLTSTEWIRLRNISTDFYKLAGYMDQCDLQGIIDLLFVELEGRKRPSYISRIYGRYRKMLPIYDREILNNWEEAKHERKRDREVPTP